MRKYFKLLIVSAFVLAMASCNKEEYKAPVSNTVEMSGVWWVEFFYDSNNDGVIVEDDGDELIYSYNDIGEPGLITTNVASNAIDSLFILDPAGIWPFKAKIPVSLSDFSMVPATGLPNLEIQDESLSIIGGAIYKKAATTLSGGKADSIFIRMEFSDDEGSQYIISGHKDTGFPEDQH